MIETNEHDPAKVVAELAPALAIVWDALERGGAKANDYIDAEGLPRDPFIISTLVRTHARQEFDARGPTLVGARSVLQRVPLTNIGLALSYGEYHFRILKASRSGGVRPPGSFAMESYYEQLTLFNRSVASMNLLVIWDLAPDGSLDLKLVCPREGSKIRSAVSVHWMIELLHPAEVLETGMITEVPDDEVLDLEIERTTETVDD